MCLPPLQKLRNTMIHLAKIVDVVERTVPEAEARQKLQGRDHTLAGSTTSFMGSLVCNLDKTCTCHICDVSESIPTHGPGAWNVLEKGCHYCNKPVPLELVTDLPAVPAPQFIFQHALQDKAATVQGPITALLVLNEVTPDSVAPYEEAVRDAVREGGMPAFTFKKVKSGTTLLRGLKNASSTNTVYVAPVSPTAFHTRLDIIIINSADSVSDNLSVSGGGGALPLAP